MYGPTGKDLVFMALFCGVVGWGAIEAVLFVFRHLSVSWQ